MKLKTVAYTSALVGCLSGQAFAQEDLEIFGYFQGYGVYSDNRGLVDGPKESVTLRNQQLNVFFGKDLGSDFRSLVNLEWSNNYDSKNSIGGAKLEEAWVSWQPKDEFRVRVGKHIPTFNAFNTIKNKMPLHPFILRPLIYEASISTKYLDLKAWAPITAFASIDGTLELNDDLSMGYSVFLGGTDFTDNNFQGADNMVKKSFGAKIGVEHAELGIKAGLSGTVDYEPFLELKTTLSDRVLPELNKAVGVESSTGIDGLISQIDAGVLQIDGGLALINSGNSPFDSISTDLDSKESQLEAAKAFIPEEQYNGGMAEIAAGRAQLAGEKEATIKGLNKQKEELAVQKGGLLKTREIYAAVEDGLPEVTRYRLGADFSYEPEFGTVFKTEYVYVGYDSDGASKIEDLNETITELGIQKMGTSPNRQFMSVMLGQRFLEDYMVYGLYSRLTNGLFISELEQGLMSYGGGLTYSPIFNVTLKAQVAAYGIQKSTGVDMEYQGTDKLYNYYFGTSVFF